MRPHRIINVIRHPVTEYQVSKAKRIYRDRNPDCECCGLRPTFWGRNNDVHHKTPVHVDPTRACAQDNLVTLCRACHYFVGHFKNWRSWNAQVLRTAYAIRDTYVDARAKHGRPE